MDMTWSIGAYIGVAFLGVCALYLLRELFCWYWKINEIRNLLEKILDRLPEKEKSISETIPNEPAGMKKSEIDQSK